MFFKILLIGILGVYTNTYAQEERIFQVFFDTDSFNLKAKEWVELVQFLKTRDTICAIEIKGYCDDRASQLYNKKLSENRARKVYEQISKYNFCTEYPVLFFWRR
jgi:outer membrane protein OmpA-like peptidoglycan-associated protein